MAPFLDRVHLDGTEGGCIGYETDSLVPFTAYLGLGLLISMAYGARRGSRSLRPSSASPSRCTR